MYNSSDSENKVQKFIMNLELQPEVAEKQFDTSYSFSFPISQMAALGTAFDPLVSIFQSAFAAGGQTGIYKVTVPPGSHLAAFKNGSGYLGSSLSNATGQISGQAVLSPVVFNPTMLFVAASLLSVEKKLDKIEQSQQEILSFLSQKERSELEGDLLFMSDILNNYKYNWDNEKYKTNNHIKVLDIKQAAEHKIIFYKDKISDLSEKAFVFHGDSAVKKHTDSVKTTLKDYYLSLYVFSFSSFLEIVLLENYDPSFLSSVTDKIQEYSLQYRELYTKCYNHIEKNSKASVSSRLLKGLSAVSSTTGKTIEKIPLISRSQLDESLIKTGEKICEFDNSRTESNMRRLAIKQGDNIRMFIDNIQTISRLYNEPVNMLFDREKLYLEI